MGSKSWQGSFPRTFPLNEVLSFRHQENKESSPDKDDSDLLGTSFLGTKLEPIQERSRSDDFDTSGREEGRGSIVNRLSSITIPPEIET